MQSRSSSRIGALAKKAIAVPLSVVLAAGCVPSAAYADGSATAVRAASAYSATAQSAMTAQASSSSLYSSYLTVLFRAANGMEEFSDSHDAIDSAQWAPEYFLFDLGNDGVPELFVRANAFGGNGLVHVYTVKSGKVVQLGSYWEWFGNSAGTSDGKLFVAGWTGGKSYVNSVSVSNGQIACQFLKAGKSTASSPGADIQMVNDYLAGKEAAWISSSKVGDYALLTKQAKFRIAQATVTAASGGTYDGSAKKPKVTVKLAGKTLAAGADYKLTYKNNTNAGKATATVTGAGDYQGSKSATFTIAQASLSGAAVTVASGGTYNGSAKKPKVTAKLSSKTLKSGTDYTLTYKSNVNAGTATVVVQGKGNYKASKSATFKIAKAANPMAVKATGATLSYADLSKAQKALTPISFTKKAQGTVTYKNVGAGVAATGFSVASSTGRVTVKKGLSRGTYSLKVQVSAAGNGNYNAASKTATFKVVVK